jgi:hypothetical protein
VSQSQPQRIIGKCSKATDHDVYILPSSDSELAVWGPRQAIVARGVQLELEWLSHGNEVVDIRHISLLSETHSLECGHCCRKSPTDVLHEFLKMLGR